MGQFFKRSLSSVLQNPVLSRFQFAKRFCVNTSFGEKFHESTKRWQEKQLSSQKSSQRTRSVGPKISFPSFKQPTI